MAKRKAKSAYVCADCGAEHSQWQGQCMTCGEWNTLSRVSIGPVPEPGGGFAGSAPEVRWLGEVERESAPRLTTGFGELDRVLGGGLVPGSVVLMGGDPGAGKSTLLLQVVSRLAAQQSVLYVTGEESLQQLALRVRETPEKVFVDDAQAIEATVAYGVTEGLQGVGFWALTYDDADPDLREMAQEEIDSGSERLEVLEANPRRVEMIRIVPLSGNSVR